MTTHISPRMFFIPIIVLLILGAYMLSSEYQEYKKDEQYRLASKSLLEVAEFEKTAYKVDLTKVSNTRLKIPVSSFEVYRPVDIETTKYQISIKSKYIPKGNIGKLDQLPKSKYNILCFGHLDDDGTGRSYTSDIDCLKHYIPLAKIVNEKLGKNTLTAYYVQTNFRSIFYSGENNGVMSSVNKKGGAKAFNYLLDADDLGGSSYDFNVLVPFGEAKDIFEYYEFDLKREMQKHAKHPHNYLYRLKTGFSVITDSNFNVIQSFLFADKYTEDLVCLNKKLQGTYNRHKVKSDSLGIARAIYKDLISDGSEFLPNSTSRPCNFMVSNIKPQGYKSNMITRSAFKLVDETAKMMKELPAHIEQYNKQKEKVMNVILSD